MIGNGYLLRPLIYPWPRVLFRQEGGFLGIREFLLAKIVSVHFGVTFLLTNTAPRLDTASGICYPPFISEEFFYPYCTMSHLSSPLTIYHNYGYDHSKRGSQDAIIHFHSGLLLF